MAPRRIAARVGASPAAPTMPAMTQSAGRSRRLDQRRGAAGGLDPGPGKSLLQRRIMDRVGDRGKSRA